jgi:malate dehydrogenase (quinone)
VAYKITDLATGIKRHIPNSFIGAGGGSLPLLEKANVPKRKRLWWFSGEWAMVKMYKSDVIAKHKVKNNGKCWCSANVSSILIPE